MGLKRALIMAVSNKFFPSLVNLLGSIKQNYPNHPPIYIYDLGLFWSFRKELENLEKVKVLDMPHFCAFWRKCYTWKTYILSRPLADLNFYLDAGNQVQKPLDEIFEIIDRENYFTSGQGVLLKQIVPKDFWQKFNLDKKFENLECINAGGFGFKNVSEIGDVLKSVYEWAEQGYALGFSPKDSWRNTGVDKNSIVRDCEMFRHDMTLLNIAMRKKFGDLLSIQDASKYAGGKDAHKDQTIWHLRLNFKTLTFINQYFLHKNFSVLSFLNRVFIFLAVSFKNLNLFFKNFSKH
jgi:hypothetical protein